MKHLLNIQLGRCGEFKCSNYCAPVCRGDFSPIQNKQGPYVPFWIETPSPRHHWAELAEALLLESEVCGHRAWPQACIHTDQGKKSKR